MKLVSFLAVPVASALIVQVGSAFTQSVPAIKLSFQKQTDKRGVLTDGATVRTSDALVWANLTFAAPLESTLDLIVRWTGSDGKLITDAETKAEKGAKEAFSGLYLAGRAHAKAGKFNVKVFAKNDPMKVLAQGDFVVTEPVLDNSKPKFTSQLAPSLNAGAEAVGATSQFYTDTKTVWLALKAETKLTKGHSITPKLFDSEGALVAFGKPIEYKDGDDRLATGFYIAGQDWAKAGGKFTFKAFWDEDPRPIAELPLSVSAANRYAVLVGIKDYLPAGAENDLAGCDLDVQHMKTLLTQNYGMTDEHITLLADLNATKANIEKALMELADKCKPGDAAIFYYSGHGAQVPDLDGDESDGWDEAIVPNEPHPALVTTEAELNRFLTDDRIAELLARFKTKNVTVIFDSCHSGTAVRAGDEDAPVELSQSKFRTFDFSRRLLKKAAEAHRAARVSAPQIKLASLTERAGEFEQDTSKNPEMGVSSNFVFVASSRPWETSGCNGLGGFFTNNLIAALKGANGQSWEQLIPGVRDNTSDRRPGQNPSVEGATRRLPFTLEDAQTDAPYIRPFASIVGAFKPEADASKTASSVVEGAAGSHRAILEGYQSLYMEQNGALYDVYPKGDNALDGKPLGRVKLTGSREDISVNGRTQTYSTAEIVSGTVHIGDRMVPVCVAVPDRKARIGIMLGKVDDADKPKLLASARAILAELGKNPLFTTVDSFKFSEVDYVIQPRLINGQMSGYLWSSGGWRMANFGGSEAEITTKVVSFITQRHGMTTRLARIGNPSPAFKFVSDVSGEAHTYAPGEALTIKVETGKPVWMLFVFASPDGSLNFVDGGQVQPGISTYAKLTAPKGTGDNLIKVIATQDKIETGKLLVGAPAACVEELISTLRAKYGDGGAGIKFLGTSGWADATLRVRVAK